MKLLPALGSMLAGGVVAAVLDRAAPQLTWTAGPVAVPPGASAAGVAVLALAFTGAGEGTNGSGRTTARNVVAGMALGAAGYEGVKMIDEEALPLVPGLPGYVPPASAPPAATGRRRVGQRAQHAQLGAGQGMAASDWQTAQAAAFFGA